MTVPKYELHENGALYIYGEGNMKDYRWNSSLLYDNSTSKTIVIEAGVTSIGNSDCAKTLFKLLY